MHETRDDKRFAPRKPIQVFVDEGLAPGTGTVCRAVNVSRTGMYLLRVPTQKAPPKFVWLGFRLPDGGQPIRALAQVVHTEPSGVLQASGVRFKYLFPVDRKRLDSYLEAPRAA